MTKMRIRYLYENRGFKVIPVNQPLLTNEDLEAVEICLKDGWISGDSPVIKKFESEWSSICGRTYGVAVSSGTVAIDLAFEALDLKPGDEVLVPSFSIISCINYLLRNQIKPIFIEANPDDWNLDLVDLRSKITKKTKAILVAHIYGLPADMDSIIIIAQEFNLKIIEDAAEAHGLKYKNRMCGSFGELSLFSFYSNKNITCGEGGMIVTNNVNLAKKIQNLRNLNFRKDERFVSDELGYNYRLSSMQAALGLSQIQRLEQIIKRRIEIASYYSQNLSNIEGLMLPLQNNGFSINNFWVYGIVLSGSFSGLRAKAELFLRDRGVGTRPFFQSLHLQPVLKNYGLEKQKSLPVSEWLSNSGFYLPNSLNITKEEQDIVISKTIEMLDSLRKSV